MRTIIAKENKSMKNKIIISGAFLLVLFSLPACNAVSGAYSDDPYGPVVSCDSTLPMDELKECISDQYEKMDKIHMTYNQEQERKWEKRNSEGIYRKEKKYYFSDTYENVTYTTIPQFNSIKNCYGKDKCQIKNLLPSHISDVSYDDYKDRGIAIEHSDSIQTQVIRRDKTCNYNTGLEQLTNCEIMGGSGIGTLTYRHFTRSYRSDNKDIIFFENKGTNILVGSLEVVRLSGGKNLIGMRIFEFHPFNPLTEGFILENTVYEKNHLYGGTSHIYEKFVSERFSPYSAFTVWDIRNDDIQSISDNFAISLDKRNNPAKIYINTGAKIYEVPLPEKGGLNH